MLARFLWSHGHFTRSERAHSVVAAPLDEDSRASGSTSDMTRVVRETIECITNGSWKVDFNGFWGLPNRTVIQVPLGQARRPCGFRNPSSRPLAPSLLWASAWEDLTNFGPVLGRMWPISVKFGPESRFTLAYSGPTSTFSRTCQSWGACVRSRPNLIGAPPDLDRGWSIPEWYLQT